MKIDAIPLNILDAVRQRLGADDENDTSFDEKIKKMSSRDLVAKWSGWHLGDESWAYTIIGMYETLKVLERKEE